MRFKNKKTGEIRDWDFGNWYQTILNPENKEKYECNLDEFIDRTVKFREEWEDVPEEPKRFYWLDYNGDIYNTEIGTMDRSEIKEIGNYFETKEEAELAVRKLKAFKRLKDKGFRFTLTPGVGSLDITPGKFQIEINADMPSKWFCHNDVEEDLDTCFGGEE